MSNYHERQVNEQNRALLSAIILLVGAFLFAGASLACIFLQAGIPAIWTAIFSLLLAIIYKVEYRNFCVAQVRAEASKPGPKAEPLPRL